MGGAPTPKGASTATPQRALLVAAYRLPAERTLCADHLDELELLAKTFGLVTAHKEPCHLRRVDASTYFTKGKLEELCAQAKLLGVDMVIVDEEINPSQQRNLEKAFAVTVLDRTELILGVFEQRAQSREARLQIELAEVQYQLPRLKRLWTHLSRQAGSVGGSGAYLKGVGEKQIEIDRRLLQRRMDVLSKELEQVKLQRATQRQARQRSSTPTFALVGYTNAGKSTLLNAMTQADVFTEDKLFATLDTTTRKFTLSNNQEALLIDTVGFIRKLPHQLVAAFKSTLEESLYADILVHVIDASHPLAEEQAATTLEVLEELGAHGKPIVNVFNKCDLPAAEKMIMKLRLRYPRWVALSALHRSGMAELDAALCREVALLRQELSLRIPQSDYALVSEIMRRGRVLHQEYVDDFVELRAEVPKEMRQRLQKYARP